tara:strand:- start:325 stop:750 length:426 start_codon:yes stop_codon:yes gene_type:complete
MTYTVPIFETQEDLEKEEEVVKRFADKGGFGYRKLARSTLDYALIKNNNAVCFLEIKCFNSKHDEYKCKISSLYKWEKMQEFEKLLPVYFVCHHSDGVVLYIRAKDIIGDVKWSGRQPRAGSMNDEEFCIFIPMDKMKRLD